jgi:hypothetical protein
MPCEREQGRFDAAMATLQLLWEELQQAAPPAKPAIVKKIEAQQERVAQASAALDACLAAHSDPPAEIDATLYVVFESNQTWGMFHEDEVKRTFRFRGPARAREISLDDIVVVRTAITTISHLHGTLDKHTGGMSLHAKVEVPFLGIVYGGDVSLHTGHARSQSGLFELDGRPLSGTDFRLVGTGFQSDGVVDLEFQLVVEGTFDAAP